MEILRGRDGVHGRDGRDGGRGLPGLTGPHGQKGDQETKEHEGKWDHEDRRERGELQDHKARLEFLVPGGQWETKVIVETLVCLDLKGNGEPRAHQQEGQCTSAGGTPPVPVTRELNSSTLEELQGVAMITK